MKIKMLGRVVFSLWVTTAIATMALSSTQERQMGGAGITVFTDSNFRGKSATFREDVSDLVRHDLNDKISSLRVGPGEQWEVCEHTNYQGRCVVVSGEEAELKRNSWGDVISSFRRVRSSAVLPPVRPTPPQNDWYIVLFDQPTYRGNPMNYKGPVSNLSGFSAGSVTIGKGVWELCEGLNFTGRCITLDKSVADLNAYGLRNRISSVRPVGSGGSGAVRPPVRPMPQPSQSDWYIVLFDQPTFRGNPTNYKEQVFNLGYNRARSVTIGKGVWELCSGANFTGHCVTLSESVADLSTQGLRNVSSVRPVSRQPR